MSHARLSPSGASRWVECPGSVTLCDGMPEQESRFSREGTFAHEAAATVLQSDHLRVTKLLGMTDGEFTLDADMARHLQEYVDAVAGCRMVQDGELFVEQRVELLPDLWGTADALVWSQGRLDVFDLKYGAGVDVAAEANVQLAIYALAALHTFPVLVKKHRVMTIGLHIVQPRRPGDPHRESEIPIEDLLHLWDDVLKPAAAAALRSDAPLSPGDHCRWCRARTVCPELRKRAYETAADVFPVDLKVPDDPPLTPPAVDWLSNDQLGRILNYADVVEQWLKAVRDLALRRAAKGDPIPGRKLVERLGNRKWLDEPAAEDALRGLGLDDPFAHKLLTPAAAEKKLGRASKPVIATLCERPVLGAALVPEADKRPALADPASVFSVLESYEPGV